MLCPGEVNKQSRSEIEHDRDDGTIVLKLKEYSIRLPVELKFRRTKQCASKFNFRKEEQRACIRLTEI